MLSAKWSGTSAPCTPALIAQGEDDGAALELGEVHLTITSPVEQSWIDKRGTCAPPSDRVGAFSAGRHRVLTRST
jgi:hypothetical protein